MSVEIKEFQPPGAGLAAGARRPAPQVSAIGADLLAGPRQGAGKHLSARLAEMGAVFDLECPPAAAESQALRRFTIQTHRSMANRDYILAETNWKRVREGSYELAVLPWGATEAHNYHLPYATDTIQCDHIAAEAARKATARGARLMVLPTIPYGVQTGQLDIPFCLNMNPSTQAALLTDLARSLEGQGIAKLVVLNGHGGNDFRQMIRELQAQVNLYLCAVDWYKVVDGSEYFSAAGDHAGEMETSVMLHASPQLVRPLTEAGDGAERKPRLRAMREGWAWAPRPWTRISVDTGVGDPRGATAEKGARYVEEVTERIGTFLAELSAADTRELYGQPADLK